MDDVTVTQALPLIRELDDDAPPEDHADAIGLAYVGDDEPGWTRVRRGRGWSYHREDGDLVEDEERDRIESLAIPPAWTDVWICPLAEGHLQATGRDDAGRKQYLYHPVWRKLREAAKFHRLADFGDALPTIRERVDADLRRRRLTEERLLALAVALLDATLIRVGNTEYARTNGAYGLTTLLSEHAEITSATIRLCFRGKAGKDQEVVVGDTRLARQLGRVVGGPSERLLGLDRGDGVRTCVDAADVNDYLRTIAGEHVSAKSFRTWGGTAVAAARLRALGPAEDLRAAERSVLDAVDTVAGRLGNTRAVARASYVHPVVLKAYRFGRFEETWDDDPGVVGRLTAEERAVRRILRLDLPPSSELESAA